MTKRNLFLSAICYLLFIGYWLITLRPLFLGQLTGNFRPTKIPQDYLTLKNMLLNDDTPSRTLYIPSIEKYGFSSATHPVLSGSELFDNASISGMVSIIRTQDFHALLDSSGIRYVIVPIDIEKKMFMTDYRFDPALRELVIQTLGQTPLPALPQYEDITIFENPSFSVMTSETPEIVRKQKALANLGLVVGGSITLLLVAWIIVSLNKKES